MNTCEATAIPEAAKPARLGDWSPSFTAGRVALLLFALLFAAYPEVILGTHSFFNGDFGLFTYPVAYYTRESFWRGELPLWNPQSNCGIPFLAQWNTTVCYPLSWFYILFPLPWSLNYFCLGHLLLAGLGMYALALRWTKNRFAASVAALAYGLNGLSLNCLLWTSNLAGLAWLPLTILCVERAWRGGRRQILWAGAAASMQMLSGAPEIVLVTWVMLCVLWAAQLWKGACGFGPSARRLALVGAVVVGLTAVQMLPFFALLHHSHREPAWSGNAWSMPAWGWANFFVPLFRCSQSMLGPAFQVEQQWTSSYYVGISIVALGLVALWKARGPRLWWPAAVAVLGLLLALGEHGLLLPGLQRVFPGLGLSRYPIKFVVATVFAFPLLAALAIKWIQRPRDAGDRVTQLTLLWVGLFSFALMAGIVAFARIFPHPGESWSLTLRNGVERVLFLTLIFNALILQTQLPKVALRGWLGLAILIVMGLDVLSHAPSQNPTVPNYAFAPFDPEMSAVPRFGETRAMVDPRMQALLQQVARPDPAVYYIGNRRSLFENCNLSAGIPKVNGFFSLYLREQAAIESLLYSPTNFPLGLADFVGVSQISSAHEFWKWLPRGGSMRLASIGQQPIFAGGQATLEALASPQFDPREVVYLPLEAQQQISASGASSAEITRSHFSAHEISLSVKAEGSTLVVLAQSLFPAWHAYVDGRPAKLWKANYAFQALEMPAGNHQVVLKYHDNWFYVGAVISGFSLLGCFIFALSQTASARALIRRWTSRSLSSEATGTSPALSTGTAESA